MQPERLKRAQNPAAAPPRCSALLCSYRSVPKRGDMNVVTWYPSIAVLIWFAACVPNDPNDLVVSPPASEAGTSTVSQEEAGACSVQVQCQTGMVSCSSTQGGCLSFDDGDGRPGYHYLANLSHSTVFGDADEGFFAVANVPGDNSVSCNGVSLSCPPDEGTAVIDISDHTAASGSWSRTVPFRLQFMVSFSNTTVNTKDPALLLNAVSSGVIVAPAYVGLEVVGMERGGHGGNL